MHPDLPEPARGPDGEVGAAPGEATYRERLWPSVGVWLVIPLIGAGATLAVLPVSEPAAAVAAAAVMALLVVWAVRSSPVVTVAAGHLVAGRARIPVDLLGPVTCWRGDDARWQRGPLLDARAYLLLRGWVDPVLRVELCDPQDPTPYWLVSTRSPERLDEALTRARASSAGQ